MFDAEICRSCPSVDGAKCRGMGRGGRNATDLGQAGVLGEWELTANVTATGTQKEFSGPLIMRHVGICTVDGPEQKTGNIKLQLSASSRVKAIFFIDGVACTYAGRKSDPYSGLLRCPDQRDVPLLMWLK